MAEGLIEVDRLFPKIADLLKLGEELQHFATDVLAKENFNTHNVPVNEVKDQVPRRRFQGKLSWFGP